MIEGNLKVFIFLKNGWDSHGESGFDPKVTYQEYFSISEMYDCLWFIHLPRVCSLGQIIQSLCISVSSFVKWEY